MVGIDTNTVSLQVKCVLTILDILQFVLVKVRPPPYSGVNNVRESLPGGHLESPVQGAGDGDTLGWLSPTSGDGGYQGVQLSLFSFSFFTKDSIARLLNASLSPPWLKRNQIEVEQRKIH